MTRENTESIFSSSFYIPEDKGYLSKLTKQFVKRAEYAQITKDEALNACSLVLTDQQGQEEYLFTSLLENGILVPSSKSIYLIHSISTQCILPKLTACYSPLCKPTTKNCYSPNCPNKSIKKFHLSDPYPTIKQLQEPDFKSKIPRFILEKLTPEEKKRQLAIEELLGYEGNFLKQLIVIRDVFAKPLLSSSTTIEESRRFTFHDTLFGNYNVLANHHKRMLKAVESTRSADDHYLFPESNLIGDILYHSFDALIDPYVRYVSNHVFAEYLYKLECHKNFAFLQFIEQQESIEKDFRLTLKGLLLSPIVRVAKYDLLFTTIMKNSPEDQRSSFHKLNGLLADLLYKINEATRKSEGEQRLLEIKHGLKLRRSSSLSKSHRISQILPDDAALLYEGSLDLVNRIPPITCKVFLFSTSLLVTRERTNTSDSTSEFTLLDKAIPLHMLKLGSANRNSLNSASQPTIFSSIRHQISSGSYHYYQRRWNSDTTGKTTTTISDNVSVPSDDDGSSTYSGGAYTMSGLKLRHRIKNIKKRMRNGKTTSLSYKKSNSHSPSSPTLHKQQQTTATRVTSPHIMRPRVLQFYHLANPTQTYLFDCPSTDERLVWKNKIKSVLPNPDDGPFVLQYLVTIDNYSTLKNVNGRYAIGCGTIWCTLPFTTSDGRNVIALGTSLGVWVAYADGSEVFRLVLPYNCHQLELFNNRILLARCSKPNRILGAMLIDDIYPPDTANTPVDTMKGFHTLQKAGVISFAVGTLRGDPILCYLRRRRTGSVRLVLMAYKPDNTTWFRKYKEYKPITIQPTDLTIIQDAVFIRSRTEGVEKVDIINWIMGSQNNNTFQHVKYSYSISLPDYHNILITSNPQTDDPSLTTIGYVPLDVPGTGLICSAKAAWPVAETDAEWLQQEILFDSEAKTVAVCYPYLIIISLNVIEIRHLETTALVQAIEGRKIRCVYVSHPTSPTALPIIHVTILHADQDATLVYQLYLKEPIAIDE